MSDFTELIFCWEEEKLYINSKINNKNKLIIQELTNSLKENKSNISRPYTVSCPMMSVDSKALGYSEEEGALTSGFRAHGTLWRLVSVICALLTAIGTIGIWLPRTIPQNPPMVGSPGSPLLLILGGGAVTHHLHCKGLSEALVPQGFAIALPALPNSGSEVTCLITPAEPGEEWR